MWSHTFTHMLVVKEPTVAKVMLPGFKCERCPHTWVPRGSETPTVCPKCKSPYWNAPRREPKGR